MSILIAWSFVIHVSYVAGNKKVIVKYRLDMACGEGFQARANISVAVIIVYQGQDCKV
jgi:hypothetical protein